MKIKMGLVEGKLVDYEEIKVLAELPSRDVLIAQTLAGLQSPIAGLVNVLNGPIRELVYTLRLFKIKKCIKIRR